MSLLQSLRNQFNAESKAEIYNQVWLDVETLWRGVKTGSAEKESAREIEASFETHWTSAKSQSGSDLGGKPHDWESLNRVEQLIAQHLPESKLNSEFALLLADAASKQIANFAFHEAIYKKLFITKANGGVSSNGSKSSVEAKRDAYINLLSALQAYFLERRRGRYLRRKTASRLTLIGLVLLAMAVLPTIFASIDPQDNGKVINFVIAGNVHTLWLVGSFGMLGAFFSRLTQFQNYQSTLSFDEAEQYFGFRVLMIRLLFGILGALLFFFFLRSRFVSGEVFPIVDEIAQSADTSGTTSVFSPSANFSKLLIWSFIAGFSERFVPDMVARTEGSGKS